MRNSSIRRVLLFSAMLLAAGTIPAAGQTDTTGLGADELFAIARDKAFHHEHEQARALLRRILQRSPAYADVRILLARTYAWDDMYDSARIELTHVLAHDRAYKDAHLALIDVELWSGKYDRAIEDVDKALGYYPSDEDLLLKKARALKNLHRNHEALNVLNSLEDVHPSAPGIASLRREIAGTSQMNSVGISYAVDAFAERAPLQYSYIQLSRRTPYGSVFVRLNYAYRFASEGTQVEFDFYPHIADGMYAYMNYGYSNSGLFPRHRWGAEYYCSLPASFEGSLGLRSLYFGPGSSVRIYTGSVGYYYRSYWISLRPYLTPGNAGLSKSASLTIRYFFGDVEDYFSFRIGAGFTPDERPLQSSAGYGGTEVFYLNAHTGGMDFQKEVGARYLIVASFDYTHQEESFSPGNYTKMYSMSIGLRFKF